MSKVEKSVSGMRQSCAENLEHIGAIARSIGWESADILCYYQSETEDKLKVTQKKDGPVTNADIAASDYILQQLRIAFGSQQYRYLSEETYKADCNGDRHEHSWVWIIDPIDGTRAFIQGNPNFAVHIALVHEGRPAISVVVLPKSGKLYYAQRGGGTFVETRAGDRRPVKVSKRDRLNDLSILTRRTRPTDRLSAILQRLPCKTEQRLGSIGCKIAAIVEQEIDVFMSLSGKSAPKDWDLAAPELILTEAGGQLTHLDGTPLIYNKEDVSQWGCLIASNGHCHNELCVAVEKILTDIDCGR